MSVLPAESVPAIDPSLVYPLDTAKKFLLNGLRVSGFRLEEAMSFSWDNPRTIPPHLPTTGVSTVVFPSGSQKSNRRDEIPMVPDLEALLATVPEELRTGWVFHPEGKRNKDKRLKADWVGKRISAIGKKALVVSIPNEDGEAEKFASAHDLRRTFSQNLEDSGVEPIYISMVMRHKSYLTTKKHYNKGNISKASESIRQKVKCQ
ncbi:MAG: hypothetical protein COA78_15745 [Blastopirellula sp.]|nr:MAG: hypothetical protein COA78_15745 [Blastopirellula sp.]